MSLQVLLVVLLGVAVILFFAGKERTKQMIAVALATMILGLTSCGISEEISTDGNQHVSANGNVADQYGHFSD